MKSFYSKFINSLSALTYLFITPALVFAQTNVNPRPSGQFAELTKLSEGSVGDIIGRAITLLFVIAVLIALAFLIYGGIKWITSGGDKAGVEGARNTIVAAIVGLVVVFLSYFILNIVLGLFGLKLSALELPKLTP